jgi:hypothetical protein
MVKLLGKITEPTRNNIYVSPRYVEQKIEHTRIQPTALDMVLRY